MARDGAHAVDIAECVMKGVELDIKRDGGAPAFLTAVDTLLVGAMSGDGVKLLAGVDLIQRTYADSPLTRHLAAAVQSVGLEAIAESRGLSRKEASKLLLARIAESRCCDGMVGYVAKNRTHNIGESQRIIDSIKDALPMTAAATDLADRMLNCSEKGIPSRPVKLQAVDHSAKSLNDEEL
jgi:hypothetical protein